ncbi:RHS repeat domain-containing protein [Gimesia fumaroli]|uniref:tRNA3(Ser)-specific nuclease WapA n=1 Tax=Gimesia fumaroli TaxID=2527976 RepID=A0A518I5R6_9PLAN|nr:RHS repeat-associated core domain-containing protein [Gimesia fumaroli]QDV48441.1 tRNA3(Ser)-specific nuclease WapA precursor [Gimesia fumaroli]
MAVINYLWSEDSYLEEYDEAGTPLISYTNEPVAFGSLISQYKDNQTKYFQFDAQGSTHQLTDSSANITDTFSYDAWGNQLTRTGTSDVYFQFIGEAGYYYDSEVDSYYVRRRSYSPITANWLSVDPLKYAIAFSGLIPSYHYASNSPLQNYDSTGLAEIPLGPEVPLPGGKCSPLPISDDKALYKWFTKFKMKDFLSDAQRKTLLDAANARKKNSKKRWQLGFVQQVSIKVSFQAGASKELNAACCSKGGGAACPCTTCSIDYLWEFMETFNNNTSKKDSHPLLMIKAPIDTLTNSCKQCKDLNDCCAAKYELQITKIVTPAITWGHRTTMVKKSAKVACAGNTGTKVAQDNIKRPGVMPKDERLTPANESYEIVENASLYKKFDSKLVVTRTKCGGASIKGGRIDYEKTDKPPKFGPPT